MATRVEQNYKERATSIDRWGRYTGIEVPYIVFDVADERYSARISSFTRGMVSPLRTERRTVPGFELKCSKAETRTLVSIAA